MLEIIYEPKNTNPKWIELESGCWITCRRERVWLVTKDDICMLPGNWSTWLTWDAHGSWGLRSFTSCLEITSFWSTLTLPSLTEGETDSKWATSTKRDFHGKDWVQFPRVHLDNCVSFINPSRVRFSSHQPNTLYSRTENHISYSSLSSLDESSMSMTITIWLSSNSSSASALFSLWLTGSTSQLVVCFTGFTS